MKTRPLTQKTIVTISLHDKTSSCVVSRTSMSSSMGVRLWCGFASMPCEVDDFMVDMSVDRLGAVLGSYVVRGMIDKCHVCLAAFRVVELERCSMVRCGEWALV